MDVEFLSHAKFFVAKLLRRAKLLSGFALKAEGRRQTAEGFTSNLSLWFKTSPFKEKLGSVEVKTSSEQGNFCPLPPAFCLLLSAL